MLRINTWAPLQEVPSADLNEWQDNTRGALPASAGNDFASTVVLGGDQRKWQSSGSLADGALVKIESSISWLDRLVSGSFRRLTSAQRVGQVSDTNLNVSVSSPIATTTFADCYTGTGAYSSTAAATAVSAGVPPVNGVGAIRSYAIVVDDFSSTGNVWLWAEPGSGDLYLYNQSGGAIYGLLTLEAPSATGKRP